MTLISKPNLLYIACCLLALSPFTVGILADQASEALKRQKAAPEHLRIKVISVKREGERKRVEPIIIWVKAKVEEVYRSNSGLQADDVITIVYSSYDAEFLSHDVEEAMKSKGAVITSVVPPILKEGESYPAFLMKQEGTALYEPVARDYSFRYVEDENDAQ